MSSCSWTSSIRHRIRACAAANCFRNRAETIDEPRQSNQFSEYSGGGMDDFEIAWPFIIPIVGTICVFTYIIVLTLSRARIRELEVRERIALIERGLVPPPEVD